MIVISSYINDSPNSHIMLISITCSLVWILFWIIVSRRFPRIVLIIGPIYILFHAILANIAVRDKMPYGIKVDKRLEVFDGHITGIYSITTLLCLVSFPASLLINTPIAVIGEIMYLRARHEDVLKISSIQGKLFLLVLVILLSNYRSMYNETKLFLRNRHIQKQQD